MNYDRPNFVHADLSLEEITKLEVARNGTFKGALGDGPGLKAARSKAIRRGISRFTMTRRRPRRPRLPSAFGCYDARILASWR